MDTITNTTLGRMANALAVLADIDPPPTAHASIHQDGAIHIHPMTAEDHRDLFTRPAFAGAVWEVDNFRSSRWSETTVRGHEVTVFVRRR